MVPQRGLTRCRLVGPLHADHIKPHGPISKSRIAREHARHRSELALLGEIDVYFGPGSVAAAAFDFNNDDRFAVGCLREDVDLATTDAQVPSEDAVALFSQVARSDAFTAPADGLIDAEQKEQAMPQVLQHVSGADHCDAGAALMAYRLIATCTSDSVISAMGL